MITKTSAFQTSDGRTHTTVEDAQRHELGLLLDIKVQLASAQADGGKPFTPEETTSVVIERILEKREGIIAILNVKTRKPRTKKTEATPRKRRTTVPSPGTEGATQQQLA